MRSAPRPLGNCESYVVFRPSPQIDGECVLSLPADCTVAAPAAAVECRSSLQCRRHPNHPDAWLSGQISLPCLSCVQFNIKRKSKRSFELTFVVRFCLKKPLDICFRQSKI